MPIDPKTIVKGATFTSRRWKGDRKIIQRVTFREKRWSSKREDVSILFDQVDYIDLRTGRTGHANVKVFAAMADGPGLVVAPK